MDSVYVVRDSKHLIARVFADRSTAEQFVKDAAAEGECIAHTDLNGNVVYTWTVDWFPVVT